MHGHSQRALFMGTIQQTADCAARQIRNAPRSTGNTVFFQSRKLLKGEPNTDRACARHQNCHKFNQLRWCSIPFSCRYLAGQCQASRGQAPPLLVTRVSCSLGKNRRETTSRAAVFSRVVRTGRHRKRTTSLGSERRFVRLQSSWGIASDYSTRLMQTQAKMCDNCKTFVKFPEVDLNKRESRHMQSKLT